MSRCIPVDVLQQLLAGTLPAPDLPPVRAHLTTCSNCQETLDRLTDRPDLRPPSSSMLSESLTPPLTSLLQRLSDYPPRPMSPREVGSRPTAAACGDAADAADADGADGARLPRVLGAYRLLEELGRGGMGIVYRAYDENLQRTVAVKVLRVGRDDAEAQARLVREARAAGGIDHDHVVAVHTVVTPADGPPYLIMQYVDGPTLRQRIQAEKHLPPREAAEICAQAAEGLAAAHRIGLVHRDVKPSNIILDKSRARAKITDFGLVRALEHSDRATREGTLPGTPEYMSPEQVRDPAHVDQRCDVYGLGATLYEALTGEVPFRGAPMMVLRQVLEDEPAPPSRLNQAVPRDLEVICLKAMAKEPGRRYATVQELALDLRRWLRGEPIRARPAGRGERCWRWCKRNPAVAGLTAAVAALLLAAAIGAAAAAVRQRELAGDADRERQKAVNLAREEERLRRAADQTSKVVEKLRQAEQEQLQRAERLLERQYTENAARLMSGVDVHLALPWVLEGLKLARRNDWPEDMHRLRLAAIQRLLPRTVHAWFHDGAVRDAVFSADGRFVATAGMDGVARVWDARTGQAASPPLKHGAPVKLIAFSPDGRHVVTVSAHGGAARVWEVATGREACAPLQHNSRVSFAAFSPDGRQIVTTSSDGGARLWDVDTGAERRQLKHAERLSFAAFDSGGQRLVTTSLDRIARVWNLATGESLMLPHQGVVFCAAFSPDQRRLVTGSYPHARVWDLDTGKEVFSKPLEHITNVVHVTYSPKGRWILTTSTDNTAKLWSADSGALHKVLRHDDQVMHGSFSPDEGRVVTACQDGTARVWSVTTGSQVFAACQHGGPVWRAAFSPDGAHVLTASGDETARLWAPPWPVVAAVKHPDRIYHASFSPDGRWFAAASFDGTVQVWNADSGQARWPQPQRQLAPVRRVHFSPDGRWLVTAALNGKARVWDAASGDAVTAQWLTHDDEILEAAFSPDGERVATASKDRTARVWDAQTGASRHVLKHGYPVQHIEFSPDGRRILTMELDDKAFIWHADTGERLLSLPHGQRISSSAFSPDGRFVATAAQDLIYVWDSATGKQLGEPMRQGGQVRSVAFCLHSRRLVTAGTNNMARVWSIATGEPLTSALPHDKNRLERASFSPDGRLVLTVGLDNSARVWDAATGEAVTPPLRHSGPVWHGTFSPDSRRVLTASGDSTARVWDLAGDERPAEDLLDLVQIRTGLELREPGRHLPLNANSFRASWARLWAKYPRQFPAAPEEARQLLKDSSLAR